MSDAAIAPRESAGWRRRPWVRLVIAGVALIVGTAAAVWRVGPWAHWGFVEYPMPSLSDIPAAVAVARDGTVWFTIEFSDAIGRLRNGTIEKIPKGTQNVEPLGLAVDADGFAWYTDAPRRAISRAGPDGTMISFALSTPIARLGRLTVAPDGAVWFAEATTVSVTRLKDGVFTRYAVGPMIPMGSLNVGPFGVAVDGHGAVWATLQNANKLVRISPGGEMAEFEVPTRRSGLGDLVVGASGTVSFLELRANKIGQFAAGRFQEFAVPTADAGLTALAVAPDGAVWFTELRAHQLGRLRHGEVTEFPLPRGDARPFGVAVDAANNVWYTDLSGRLGRLAAERAKAR